MPREARELLEVDGNEAYYSAASIWEIAIKSSLRRKDFRIDLDRLLIPQSLVEPLTLLTNDALLDRYRVGARVV